MKTDALVERLVNSYGSWVQKDCENTEGGTGRYTRELWPYDTMFSPIQVNRLTIKNRLVMAPMGNCQMAEETGRPNDKMREYFFAPRRRRRWPSHHGPHPHQPPHRLGP